MSIRYSYDIRNGVIELDLENIEQAIAFSNNVALPHEITIGRAQKEPTTINQTLDSNVDITNKQGDDLTFCSVQDRLVTDLQTFDGQFNLLVDGLHLSRLAIKYDPEGKYCIYEPTDNPDDTIYFYFREGGYDIVKDAYLFKFPLRRYIGTCGNMTLIANSKHPRGQKSWDTDFALYVVKHNLQ